MKTPDQYQIEGAEFLAAKNWALIADKMGLGKTGQLILACDNIWAEKILVICPSAARINWHREFGSWSTFGNKDFVVTESLSDKPGHKTICSFNYARDNVAELTKWQWDVIIVDESQNIKEPNAGITVAVYGKAGLVRHTKRMWLASGTPAPNHYGELWPMLYTFGLTRLEYGQFIARYCHTKRVNHGAGFTNQIVGSKIDMAHELVAMLEKIMIRRDVDVLSQSGNELPPITYEDIYVEPTPVDLEIYSSTFSDSLGSPEHYLKRLEDQKLKVEEGLKIMETTGQTAYLEGIYSSVATLRRHNGLAKMPELIKHVARELQRGDYEKIVIFAVHHDVVDGIREGLKFFGSVSLYGGTRPNKRQRNIDRFMTDPKCRVFVGNIDAAGTAITLTSASEVLLVEWPFKPGPIEQAIARVWRRTQTVPVRCRFASIQDSIDEKITHIYKRKIEELMKVFDETKTTATAKKGEY